MCLTVNLQVLYLPWFSKPVTTPESSDLRRSTSPGCWFYDQTHGARAFLTMKHMD
jgi:hypothetical protein